MTPYLENFPKATIYPFTNFIFGNAVFFSNGDVWRLHRRALQSSFKQTKFFGLVGQSFEQLCDHMTSLVPGSLPVYKLLDQ